MFCTCSRSSCQESYGTQQECASNQKQHSSTAKWHANARYSCLDINAKSGQSFHVTSSSSETAALKCSMSGDGVIETITGHWRQGLVGRL